MRWLMFDPKRHAKVERGVRKRANLAYFCFMYLIHQLSPVLMSVVLCEYLLLEVVNNNSKFPIVEKKN
jgi:hypothetical protein